MVEFIINNWIIIAIVVVIGAIIFYGFTTACPECKKFFADQEVNKELIDQTSGFKMISIQDKHKDSRGNIIKVVERQEQVQVIRSSYKVSHKCKFCNHNWETTDIEESTNG